MIIQIYNRLVSKYQKLIRFVISGGSATAMNMLILYVLVTYVGVWYLAASILAFLSAFVISFFLQKFWTFEDNTKDRMRMQMSIFLATMILGLGLNTLLVFLGVEYVKLPYLAGQLCAGVIIAVINFFVYQKLIFRKRHE